MSLRPSRRSKPTPGVSAVIGAMYRCTVDVETDGTTASARDSVTCELVPPPAPDSEAAAPDTIEHQPSSASDDDDSDDDATAPPTISSSTVWNLKFEYPTFRTMPKVGASLTDNEGRKYVVVATSRTGRYQDAKPDEATVRQALKSNRIALIRQATTGRDKKTVWLANAQ